MQHERDKRKPPGSRDRKSGRGRWRGGTDMHALDCEGRVIESTLRQACVSEENITLFVLRLRFFILSKTENSETKE